MLYHALRSRIRSLVFAITAPLGAAALVGCDADNKAFVDPGLEPQRDYASGGDPEYAMCSDPTPGERWTAAVTPAGGTFTMGPNSIIVPANTVSASGLIYLRELSSTALQMRLTSTQTLNQTVEVVMSTENCEIDALQTVWLYDEPTQEFEDLVTNQPNTGNETMRFWTIQPGAYALAN